MNKLYLPVFHNHPRMQTNSAQRSQQTSLRLLRCGMKERSGATDRAFSFLPTAEERSRRSSKQDVTQRHRLERITAVVCESTPSSCTGTCPALLPNPASLHLLLHPRIVCIDASIRPKKEPCSCTPCHMQMSQENRVDASVPLPAGYELERRLGVGSFGSVVAVARQPPHHQHKVRPPPPSSPTIFRPRARGSAPGVQPTSMCCGGRWR